MTAVEIYRISELLGHSSVEMTKVYAHLSPDYLADVVNAIGQTPRRTILGQLVVVIRQFHQNLCGIFLTYNNHKGILMKKYFALFALILIQGCSSGGGDSAPPPTAPDTVFQLFPSNAFTAGTTDNINYTGSDTLGGVWSGTYSFQIQSQSTFLGQPAIPSLGQIQLTNSANGAVISNVGTGYFSTSASDRRYLGYSDSFTTTVSANTTAIPQTAKIGDFGVIGTYTDNAGSVDTQSWRLDDGGSGRAKLVKLSTERDQFGNLELSSTTTSLIDTSGNVISQTLVLFVASDNATITLNSN